MKEIKKECILSNLTENNFVKNLWNKRKKK